MDRADAAAYIEENQGDRSRRGVGEGLATRGMDWSACPACATLMAVKPSNAARKEGRAGVGFGETSPEAVAGVVIGGGGYSGHEGRRGWRTGCGVREAHLGRGRKADKRLRWGACVRERCAP